MSAEVIAAIAEVQAEVRLHGQENLLVVELLGKLASRLDLITAAIQQDPAEINQLAALSADLKAQRAAVEAEIAAVKWTAQPVPFAIVSLADPLPTYDAPDTAATGARPGPAQPLVAVEVKGTWLRITADAVTPAVWVRGQDVDLPSAVVG